MNHLKRVVYSVKKRFVAVLKVEITEDLSFRIPRGLVFQDYKGSQCLGLCFSVLTENELYGITIPWWERVESAVLLAPVIRDDSEGVKSGLVVMAHWVDSVTLAHVMRLLCGHVSKPSKMDHSIEINSGDFAKDSAVHYHLRSDYRWNVFKLFPESGLRELAVDSFEEFLLARHHLYSFGGGSFFSAEGGVETFESDLKISCHPADTPAWSIGEQVIRADLSEFLRPFQNGKLPSLYPCAVFPEIQVQLGPRRRLLDAVKDTAYGVESAGAKVA